MRFTSAALLIALGSNDASAFSFTFVTRRHGGRAVIAPSTASSFLGPKRPIMPSSSAPTRTRTSTSAASVTMLVESSGGMEELHELTESADTKPLAKQIRKSPSLFKIAGLATIPLSAAFGFGLMPSRRIVAHGVGAVISGVAGAVGKSRLDALTESNAKPAIAQALIDSELDDPVAAQQAVQKVQDDFGLLDEDFAPLCTEIYTTYLMGMIKYNPIPKTSEIKELEVLKEALMLDNLQVGEAHHQAAVDWYRQTCLFTPEEDLDDPAHPDRQAMDKFLFLTERALAGETPEAFSFEMTRVAKAFSLTFSEAQERVAETVEPFYHRALKSTRSKLGTHQVSSAMLERARRTLGISEETAKDMHVVCYNEHVRELLGLPDRNSGTVEEDEVETPDVANIKFPEGSLDQLKQLQEVLSLSDTDASYELALEVTPLYQSTALAAMEKVLDKTMSPDEAWDIMEERRDELFLKEENSKDLIASMVMQALGGPLETTNKFAKVNNEAATYDNLLETLEAKQAILAILAKSGWDSFEKFDENFCNPWDKKSANGFLSSEERIKLYRIFLQRSVRKAPDGKLSGEAFDNIKQVQGLLGITDMQADIESRGAFGPGLQKVLQTAMTEMVQDYTPALFENMQAKVDEVMTSSRLSNDFLREVGVTFYAKAVALVSEESPGGIPTKPLANALAALQSLYNLEKEDTYSAHMEYFGSVYKKSVLEAMGTTGVIRPEFRDSLDELRDRLGVSSDDTRALFLEAVEEKMIPMVKWIGSEMERTMLSQKQLAERRGKDMGEDVFQSGKGADGVLGLGAEVNIMSDIIELVDFYEENDILETKTETNEEGEEVTTTIYPITALGAEALDQELAELLYRQFIVGGFTTQGEKGARYESARETFAGILGLEKSKRDEINSNIASTVYDNYVTNAMQTKGAMDQQDMMFLANIQSKLSLSAEEGEKMLLQTQKKILSEEINTLMDDPRPEGLKAFREKCNALGMNMFEDVGISKQRLARMFEAEIVPGLKSGAINAEDSDILGEIQESIGLEGDECESMFETVLMRLSKSAMDLIESELLRGREDNTVDLIKELVRYAAFTGGDLALSVEESVGNQVLNLYDALDLSDEDEEQVKTNQELLRVAMGLSD